MLSLTRLMPVESTLEKKYCIHGKSSPENSDDLKAK
jgi:hypothetical protein